jgi:hypothetical protein
VSGPWTFDQAVAAQRDATQKQEQAERFVKTAYRDFAEKERVYREALAKRITELRAEGISVTLCGDLARGDSRVAGLKYERDVAEGVREAAGQAVWRATADRKTVEGLMDWSKRRELADGFSTANPVFESVIGGRR